jgi:preprotein translocase subunit YajC
MTTTLIIYNTLLTVFIIEIILYFTNKEPHYQKMKEQNRILDQLEKGYFTNNEPHYQKMKEQNRILDQLERGYLQGCKYIFKGVNNFNYTKIGF